ncbi:MAG TPA: SWIM zinc finger family protein [Nitrososphaeraceae archaeon]
MTTNTIEQRVKEIPNYFIKRIDMFTYEVKSVNPRNQGEVKYMVYNSKNIGWSCTCPSYIYSKTPDNATCKHIIRVRNMILESAKRQALKAQKEKEKIDLGDIFN